MKDSDLLTQELSRKNEELHQQKLEAKSLAKRIENLEKELEQAKSDYKGYVGTSWGPSGSIQVLKNSISYIDNNLTKAKDWESGKEGVWLRDFGRNDYYRFTKTTAKRIYYITKSLNQIMDGKNYYSYSESFVSKNHSTYPFKHLDWEKTLELFDND